ncbi:MAG: chorismate lyase [Magnetococcus sp. YQC-5]
MPLPFPTRFLTPWLLPSPFPDLAGALISMRFQAILASTDSLTRRLEILTGQPSHIRLETQQLQSNPQDLPDVWSPDYPLDPSSPALTRNAWLAFGEHDLVFAHSQLTLTGMSETTQQAIRRGEQPLGSLFLSRDKPVARHMLQLAAASAPTLAQRLQLPEDKIFIGRRSLFMVTDQICGRILELFLTDLSL